MKNFCGSRTFGLKEKIIQGSPLFLFFLFFSLLSSSLNAQNCSVNAGVDFTVCANSTLTLGGGKAGLFQGAGNITWSQVSGPSAIITDPSNLNTTVTSIVGGNSYKFRLSATCLDGSLVYDEVTVTVSSISIANAGPDQTVCPGNAITNLAAGALKVGETGAWSVQGTNNGITVVTNNLPTSAINASATQSGNQTLRWTVTSGACSSFDDIIITNRGGVSAVSAGLDRAANSCYATTQTVSPSGTSYGGAAGGQTGVWTVVNGPNIPTITTPTSNTSTFTNLVQGTYTFRWTVSGSCVNGSDDMQVTVPAPNGGITTAAITSPGTTSGNTTNGTSNYCDGRTNIVLVGSVPTKPNETVTWVKTAGAAGDVIASTNATTTNINNLNNTSSYTYSYTISSTNGCPASVATRTISWTSPPTLNITTPSPLSLSCGVSSATINYTSTGGTGSVQWMIVSGPATPTYPTIPTGWTNGAASSATINGLTKPGTYQLRFQKLAGSGSGCSTIFQDFTLVVAQSPTASNAGTDQTLACNVFNTNLVGNVPAVGTGMWTQVSGPNTATLPSPYLNNSPISGLVSGKYVFRWLINSGNTCTNNQDDVSVIVSDPTPTASAAGSDLTICNSTPFILTGNKPKLNEWGTWTVVPSSGVAFSDIHSPTATATGMAPNTTYTFTWTISNACGSSSDNVVLTTNATAGPIPSIAGTDQCFAAGTTSIAMAGNNPGLGTGLWTKLTGGSANILSPSQNNSTINGLTDGTYTFEWSITRNTCTVTRDTVMISISAPATIASAGSDQNVCGSSATLAGNNPAIGTGSWTQVAGPGGAVITDPSAYNSTVTGLISGAYTFRWTILNNACGSNYDDVQLNVSIPPTIATAGPDQSICSGTTVTMAGNAITTGTGTWSIVSGPNSPTIISPGSPTTTITGLTNGLYTIRWKSYNGAYCPASTDDVIVDVTQAVTTASLGNNQVLCGATSATLTGNVSTTGTWTQDAGPNTANINPISSSTSLATGLIAGVYTFRYTYTVPTACVNTATITVTVSAMPDPANAGPDQTVCDVNSVIMAGNTASVGSGAWSRVTGPNTPSIVASNPLTSIGTTTALMNGTYIYRWTITNGACTTSDDVIITRSSSTMVANAGPDQNSVCGSITTMAANTPAPGVGTWTQVSGPNTAIIASTILPNTSISGLIPGTYVFRWSITNGICAPSNDDVSVTVFATPTVANAGPDQSLCGANSTNLAANTILVGTGQWSQISGPNTATIALNTDPTTGVSGLIEGTYVFQWTSSNGSCASSDNVSVSVTPVPTTSNAGTDQSICLFSPLNLAANTPTEGFGMWSQEVTQTATIQDPSAPNSSITGLVAGTYRFKWTIANSPCPSSADEVLITVNDLPSLALAGPDQTLCNVNNTTLAATPAAVGTGTWTLVSGPNIPLITNINLGNTTVTGMVPGTYIFDWTVANGPCTSSDQVQVIIYATPTVANAGADQNICGTTFTTLDGNVAVVGTGTWTRVSGPNTPTITNPNSATSTITGLVTGTYVFKWTITNGVCASTSDNVQITVTTGTVTVSNAGIDQTGAALCGLTSTTLAANNPVTGTGTWSVHSGTGGSFSNGVSNTATFNGDAGSSYTLRWTITNGACASFDDVIVTFPKNPTPANAGADQNSSALCGLTSTTLAANTPTVGTGSWSVVSGAGESFGNLNNPSSSFSGNAGTIYNLKWTIVNAPCTSSEDNVTIEFKTIPNAPTGTSPQSFCTGDLPLLNDVAVIGNNIKWYDASTNGNSLGGATPLLNGATYYASQTVNGCESNVRTAAQVSVLSCVGPLINDVTVSLNENSSIGTIVYDEKDANTNTDKDWDNDDIIYSIIGGNGSGAFAINSSTGIITVADATKIDFETITTYVLTVRASDGLNNDNGTVTINITNLNDNVPVATNDSYSVNEGATLNTPAKGVLVNDTDADGDALTSVLVSTTSNGALTLNADGSFTYIHNGGETTTDQFTYKVNDGTTDGNTATVTITINPVNDVPVALNDSYSVNEGATLSAPVSGVLVNDTDADGDALTSILVSTTSNGAFTLNADGSFTYIHNGGETTTDQFTYKVNDGTTDGNTATVTITINPVNDVPVAVNDSYSVNEGATLNIPAKGVLVNDTDADGDALTSILVSTTSNGALALNADGSFTYTHNGGETTTDQFTYKVNDGTTNGNTATVTITINPVNDVPVAVNDSYSVNEGATLNAPVKGVLGNDTDADGDALTSVLVSSTSNGTLTLNSDGTFTYTHNGSETTTDQFTYKVNDGTVDGNTATVTITINPVNDVPVATNDNYTVNEGAALNTPVSGVLGNDTDADGDVLTSILVSSTSNGTLTLNSDGSFTYTHNGSETTTDQFTYKVNDGTTDGNTATVTITINPVNDVPVAVNDSYSVNEGATLNTPVSGVLGNDTDADGDVLTSILVSSTSNGALTLNADGSFTYTHNGGETTTDQFTYKVNDGTVDGNTATVTITINPVNDVPVAVNDSYSENEGATLNVPASGVLGNDTDADGDALTSILVSTTSNGALTLNADGSFTYTHNGSETTTDQFTYKVNDGNTDSNIATVTITITPVNDGPVATNDSYTLSKGGTLNISAPGILINDIDAEGNTLTTIRVSETSHGTLILNGDGSFTYTHDGSNTNSDQFTYKVNDGTTDGNTVTVSLTINVTNHLPQAVNNEASTNQDTPVDINVLANDTGLEDGNLVLSIISQPSHGNVSINSDNSITYVPVTGYSGNDNFTYRVCDANSDCSSASVTVAVTPAVIDHIPLLKDDTDTTIMDVAVVVEILNNDTGLEDGSLIITSSKPSHGSVLINNNQSVTYTPDKMYDGVDEFTYQVCDGDGDCATATVRIVVKSDIFVPEGFSPNGDGINDFFEIPELSDFNNVSITIFNRWGNIVFEDSNYKNNWDGKANKNITGSETLPVGTYFYIITIKDTGRKLNGYIYLNR